MEKRNLDSTEKKKAKMLHAIEANYGNISKAARMTKIASSTHYKWLMEDRAYAVQAEDLRDISFRNTRDNLYELSMKMAEKGNAYVLNQLLRIFFKNVPEEMRVASYHH